MGGKWREPTQSGWGVSSRLSLLRDQESKAPERFVHLLGSGYRECSTRIAARGPFDGAESLTRNEQDLGGDRLRLSESFWREKSGGKTNLLENERPSVSDSLELEPDEHTRRRLAPFSIGPKVALSGHEQGLALLGVVLPDLLEVKGETLLTPKLQERGDQGLDVIERREKIA